MCGSMDGVVTSPCGRIQCRGAVFCGTLKDRHPKAGYVVIALGGNVRIFAPAQARGTGAVL
jgi:hypothetical protein